VEPKDGHGRFARRYAAHESQDVDGRFIVGRWYPDGNILFRTGAGRVEPASSDWSDLTGE
jgi:hypothetical protein